MTRNEAREILRQAGEVYATRADLARISARVFDPMIKRACDRLRADPDQVERRAFEMWVELTASGPRVHLGHAAAEVKT